MKHVQLITDGACIGNPGPGGWAFILRYGEYKREAFGSEPHTTNNRMELTAAIEGMKRLKEACSVEIVTDSQYVKNGITQWIKGWKKNGWKTASKQPVVNKELWIALDELVARHETAWKWTKGHASHEDNNRCDELATRAARDQISSDRRAGDCAVNSEPPGAAAQRICLFGGTFDPVHKAHLRIAQEAANAVRLTKVLFIPAGHPPHKQLSQITPFEHRYRMVELACRGNPLFEASRLEQGDQFSYSINTVERLALSLGPGDKLFFLIGSDAFDEIQTWHRWRELICRLDFIVVSRPGHDFAIPPGARVHRLDGLALPISSTDIRDRLERGEPTPELPDAVRSYIDANHLYGAQH